MILEVPLEETGAIDVHFCRTAAMKVPENAAPRLQKCLDCCTASKGILDAYFAFDAEDNYKNEPCLYALQPEYDAKSTQDFFSALGTPAYSKKICNVIENAPKD